jgi:hypothetical protein
MFRVVAAFAGAMRLRIIQVQMCIAVDGFPRHSTGDFAVACGRVSSSPFLTAFSIPARFRKLIELSGGRARIMACRFSNFLGWLLSRFYRRVDLFCDDRRRRSAARVDARCAADSVVLGGSLRVVQKLVVPAILGTIM